MSTRMAQRLHARYATGPAVEAEVPDNDVLASLLDHRSVRSYLDEPLPPSVLPALVAAAQSASSSSNLQLWSVIAVEDKAHRERLAALASNQAHIKQAPLFLVWVVDLARPAAIAGPDAPTEALAYFETFLTGAVDASLAAQNAVVAAEALGLGTVYIGALRNRPAEVAAELGLPPGTFALFGLVVGRPDPASSSGVKPRLAPSVVLHRERYQSLVDAAAIARYDEVLAAQQTRQGGVVQRWSERIRQYVSSPKSLHGRDRLRQSLESLGFPLR